MELVSFAKHVFQNAAEQAASYRIGQTALRYLDRALWVVEKCARWAVPPPLDADDRPQPELVRPLPWVFFLAMLVVLRVTRESISLVNLVLGKPPLRSADVVMFIQSKRRYLRTLKYQGNRNLRARSKPQGEPWYSSIQALFEFTMCFRRSRQYGNNNTTNVSNNDEVLVVKRGKRTREGQTPASPSGENAMERLIQKMMVDLDAESDDDSSFTLTNANSLRSDRSEDSDPEQDTTLQNAIAESPASMASGNTEEHDLTTSPLETDVTSSTPDNSQINSDVNGSPKETNKEEYKEFENGIASEKEEKQPNKADLSEPSNKDTSVTSLNDTQETPKKKEISPKEDTKSFLQSERCTPQKQSPKHSKFANGRTMSVPGYKKKGFNQKRRDSEAVTRVSPADEAI